jgi:hypothetical protein
LTRIGGTFIDVGLTERARITRKTDTAEGVECFDASGTVLTRIGGAFIDVGLTERA